jgi:hypothetical protein
MTGQRRVTDIRCREHFTRLSFHEAGHAVACSALGVPVNHIWRGFDDDGGHRGECASTTIGLPALTRLALLAAGSAAEARAHGDALYDAQDTAQMVKIAHGAHPKSIDAAVAAIEQARATATGIVNQNWSAVCALAIVLDVRGEMSGAEIEACLSDVPVTRISPSEPQLSPVRSRPSHQPSTISEPDLRFRGAQILEVSDGRHKFKTYVGV